MCSTMFEFIINWGRVSSLKRIKHVWVILRSKTQIFSNSVGIIFFFHIMFLFVYYVYAYSCVLWLSTVLSKNCCCFQATASEWATRLTMLIRRRLYVFCVIPKPGAIGENQRSRNNTEYFFLLFQKFVLYVFCFITNSKQHPRRNQRKFK